MCQFRAGVIAADAAGEADEREARLARAHVSACVPCGRVYRHLRREMRSREFQRAASAAFLPMPVVSLGHITGFGKLAVWIEQRINLVPHSGGDRAAEALGGAGLVKAATTGTALVVAGSAIGGHLVHDIMSPKVVSHHHRPSVRIERLAERSVSHTKSWQAPTVSSAVPAHVSISAGMSRVAPKAVHHSLPTPPSKSLHYLQLGGSSGGRPSTESRETSVPTRATAASASEDSSSEGPPSEGSSQPSQSGGGANPVYLGK
jgi:hypothetical protein